MVRPISHAGFEIRDRDRVDYVERTGKSIFDSIKEGVDVPECLLNEEEEILATELALKKERKPRCLNSDDHNDSKDSDGWDDGEVTLDCKDRPVYDDDDLEIDYEDKD